MTFKCEKANKILAGEEYYSLRQWREDLRKEIDCIGEDEDTQEKHFLMHAGILYLGFALIDYPKVKETFLQIHPAFNKDKESRKLAGGFIRSVRKDFAAFEELLVAMVLRKALDFQIRGLSEEKAGDLACKWIQEEINV